ncbi:MAG: glycosyltransferase [Myxococcota bacterium]|nr:glycosyltransferase [Myxococcales bacterium]
MTAPSIAIVMPAYNAAHLLPRVLPAALGAARGATVLVVDPGSTDGTARVAEELGARVVRLPKQAGPARARNVGVANVDADVVLFIDSDCVAKPDVVDRVREAFAADPELVSLTGSYDDAPPEPNFFSQYMNLRHHITHHRANREDATFWAGCGAVRREVFLAVGGFDEQRFPRPQIEDIELGYRMREKGGARLDPDLQVTHLKRWTGRNAIYTDVVERGIPWTTLMLERGGVPNDLNLRTSQRVAAALAPLALACVAALPVALAAGAPAIAAAAAIVLATSVSLQIDLVREFARLRGPLFALRAWLFHQVHLSYSGATFVYCWLRNRL